MNDCCITSNEQFFIYIMVRTSYMLMRWCWCSLCTKPTCWVRFL